MTSISIRLLAALAALCVLVGCGSGDSPGDDQTAAEASGTPVITGEPAGYNAADVTFASAMVPHHQQAIEMSTMALQRSVNPELITLANQIVATQQPEVNILNVLLVQWNENPDIQADPGGADGGASAPSNPGKVDDATIAELESLRGPEFDTLWLQSMIGHHQGTVAMAKSEVSDGKNVDAIAIAKTIEAEQEAQIGQMTRMLEGMP
ncbi:putative lipoprotein [Mycolicibacterium aurum]|uniref:Putative lipoprotein n=1 Tax=Mycolicibacterium aurum TaxID=1791 RepID=A0A448IFJ7_MYCAU|nr:DUF305 domain-containing protein [Mycolicibacterium aurum]VEG51084.1 putative lipoprotein [Mycolicibacterium aurum]